MSLNIKNGDELIPVAGTPKVTRSSLELENVDNTADLDKPVSTATQVALDLKADITDLDKKANKTFIEAVDSDTNVVTVPNDVAGFAAISKICGKTIKDGEVLKSAPVKSVVSCGRNFASLDDYGVCEATTNKRFGYQYIGLSAGTYTINATVGSSTYYIAKVSTNGSAGDAIDSVKSSSKIIKVTLGEGEGIVIYNLDNYDIGRASMAQIMVCKGDVNEFIPYNKTTVSVPKEILDLPDYGVGVDADHCNWVDFENGVYHHDYVSVDLTKKGWTSDGNGVFHTACPTNAKVKAYGVCNKFNVRPDKNAPSDVGDMVLRDPTYNVMYVKIEPGTTIDTSGVVVYYELADDKKEIIDISSILYPVPVETGGTITFENEYNLDVQNTVLYKKEVL